jgi:hypothetical protein
MRRFLRSAGAIVGRVLGRLGLLALALGALVGVYAAVARPWLHTWGATEAERVARLPGDEIVPGARSQETRAIGIHAPAPYVWAWVSQLGQDRAGFYSYQVLENLVGCEMPNVQQIVPRLGRWRVGDKLWMYPPRKAGGIGYATLLVHEPGHALGFATRQLGAQPLQPPDASWSFVVEPAGDHASRLLFRGRGAGGLRFLPAVLTRGAFEPMHFAMERRTMTSIKALAEGRTPSPEWDALQVVLWMVVFGAFVTSGVVTVVARRPWRPVAGFVLLGLLFMLLTLVQPHPALGAALLLAVAILPGWRRAVGRGRNVRAPRAGGVQILRG